MSTDDSRFAHITQELGHQLGERFSTAVVLFHAAVAERLGLNVTDWKCASLLWREGPCNPSRLAELTGMSSAATTQVIDRLERAGIVKRERDTVDRRKVVLHPVPNPALSEKLQEVFAGLGRSMTQVMQGFTLDQLAAILDFVEKTSAVLEKETVRLRRQVSSKDIDAQTEDIGPVRGYRSRTSSMRALITDNTEGTSPG